MHSKDHFTQMLAFLWTCQYKSFSAAAREKNMSPSAISKLITRLEQRIKVRLFLRETHHLVLTNEGEQYLRSVRHVVDALAECDAVAESLPYKVSGALKIQTMASFAKHQILPWLPEFLATYPHLSIEIQGEPQLVDTFEQGLDIAIHSGVLPCSSRIARRIGMTNWITCAAPSYIEAHGLPTYPDQLMKHRCLQFSFETPWNSWVYLIEGENIVVPVVPQLSFKQGDFIRSMALSGAGIVRLADFHIGEDIRQGRLVPLLNEFSVQDEQPVYLIYADRVNISPRIKAFTAFLEEKIRCHPWQVSPNF